MFSASELKLSAASVVSARLGVMESGSFWFCCVVFNVLNAIHSELAKAGFHEN